MEFNDYAYIIVGSGLFGSTIANKIVTDLNLPVLILEKRAHIGGNCYSKQDDKTSIEYHQYGPHIFHTSNEAVWTFINQFTTFNNYKHAVYSLYNNKIYSMPINLATINKFFNKEFSPKQAEQFLADCIAKDASPKPQNLEEKAISLIGKDLYEAFIKGYTIKQWETDPTKLPSSIITRLPVRYNFNNNYFNDTYQGIPSQGYTKIFESMLNHDLIDIQYNVDFFDIQDQLPKDCNIIYTGPIDRFFNYKHGKLGWRTVTFEKEYYNQHDKLGNSVINYSDASTPYTRVHEFKHYHTERDVFNSDQTFIMKEKSKFATGNEDPYYPINTAENKKMYALYEQEAATLTNVIIDGRLGSYKYWDMHHCIAKALSVFESKIKTKVIANSTN